MDSSTGVESVASRPGLSLRYKILFVLIFLPLTLLGIYLFVAISVVKKDKLAYVYESTAAVSRTLSSNAMTTLNSILSTGKPCFQEFLLRQQFAEVSHGILTADGIMSWIAVYTQTGNGFELTSFLAKPGQEVQADLSRIHPEASLLPRLLTESRLVTSPFRDNKILIGEKVQDNDKVRLFLVFAESPDLQDLFSGAGTSESYLIDDKGRILMGPQGGAKEKLSQRTGDAYMDSLFKQAFVSGAEALVSPSGEELLASFSRTGFAGSMVVSLTSKKNALNAVSILVVRSLLFVMVLISASVIFGLFASNNLTASLTDLFRATKQVTEGNFAIRVTSKSRDEVGALAESFNTMADEVSRLLSETAEKARMQNELNTARTVQETLFPPTQANLGIIKVAGFYEPASECGGDWWYYSEVGDKIFLWMGDATGHGAPAALITSAARSASTVIERLGLEPKEALRHLNRAIFDVSKGRIMMTFFLASIDKKTRVMTFSNASHEAPFLIHRKEGVLKKKDLIPLNDVVSPRLGQSRETEYEQHSVQLEAGDRLLLYTDGVPDIQNANKESWGERNFIKCVLNSTSDFPPVHLTVQSIVDEFSEFRGSAPLIDDVTFFMIQVEEIS